MDDLTSSSVFSFVFALLGSHPVPGSDALPRVNPGLLSTVTRCLAVLASASPGSVGFRVAWPHWLPPCRGDYKQME